MTNDNCLEGIQCPACASDGPFYIECLAMFLVSDSGTDEYSGVDWSEDSHCDCHACSHHATVAEFMLTTQAKGGAQ